MRRIGVLLLSLYLLFSVGTVSGFADAPASPVFEDGVAQPVFDYETTVREVVYVETNVDTDGDGRADLVQVMIQRPAATNEGMKAAAIFEARPYNAGCTDAYDYDIYNARIVNAHLEQAAESTVAAESDYRYVPAEAAKDLITHAPVEVGTATDGGEIWDSTDNVNLYDYWLVRGYAVVSSAGLGTLGSDGFSTCGSADEVEAFATIVRWLSGDESVKAYSAKDAGEEVRADWCNGNVAMTGQSYAGTTAFAVAATGVPGLKTIIPRAGIASYYDYYRSQGVAAAGLYYPGDDCDLLADYCMSRRLDEEDYAAVQEAYEAYLADMIEAEDALRGDYNTFWDERNYTKNPENIQCSALIVHGLNDFNVKTKQFDMMYKAFRIAGQDVELILHQGAHCTPEQIDGLDYNMKLGRWLAYYLYGVDNGAPEDAKVYVQSNLDLSWNEYETWDSAETVLTLPLGEDECTFTSDLSVTSFDTSLADQDEAWIEYCSDMAYTWESEIVEGRTNASAVIELPNDTDLHISGTPRLTIHAAADRGTGILSAMLVDVAPEGMEAVVLEPYTEAVPTAVVAEGALEYGSSLENKDILQFSTTDVNWKIITRGWMDIQNRSSIYNVDVVEPGTYYDFTLELQPTDYIVAAGHKLAVVLYSVDPEVTYWPEEITNYTAACSASSLSFPTR